MPEVPLDFPRQWVEFVDPADSDQRIRADLTWLTSRWACIFGNGCQGIYSSRPDDGCCTLGAHFSGKKDERNVAKWVKKLDPQRWQFAKKAEKKGPFAKGLDGDRKTRVVEGACIFLNRPDFDGDKGCVLHHLAASEGVSFVETKPDVCWQLPIRRTFEKVDYPDGTEHTVVVITEYDRRGWGEGGHDLDWYCSGNTEAHVGQDPVFISSRDELIALVGKLAYDELVVHCEARVQMLDRATGTLRIGMAPHLADPV